MDEKRKQFSVPFQSQTGAADTPLTMSLGLRCTQRSILRSLKVWRTREIN
jgi:hypothetical protein